MLTRCADPEGIEADEYHILFLYHDYVDLDLFEVEKMIQFAFQIFSRFMRSAFVDYWLPFFLAVMTLTVLIGAIKYVCLAR